MAEIAKAIKVKYGIKVRGTDFTPIKLTSKKRNESSLVIDLKANPTSLLLTGEIRLTLPKGILK